MVFGLGKRSSSKEKDSPSPEQGQPPSAAASSSLAPPAQPYISPFDSTLAGNQVDLDDVRSAAGSRAQSPAPQPYVSALDSTLSSYPGPARTFGRYPSPRGDGCPGDNDGNSLGPAPFAGPEPLESSMGSPPRPRSAGKPPALTKFAQENVVEMLDHVGSLGVDPVKESDMLWIAEEAFHTELPPGWEECKDAENHTYFHNVVSDECKWQHPMQGVFKEMCEYWRQVHVTGGFWDIDVELAKLEENIGRGLNDWMETFDDKRQKFYYNRVTEESRFEDPRPDAYRELYLRIDMVAKMKEKSPLLARAQRPEDPTSPALESQGLQEQQQQGIDSNVQMQAAGSASSADPGVVSYGNQPLKHRVELRKESSTDPGSPKEAVLYETGDQRELRATLRIQACTRGKQARAQFGPLVAHQAHLDKQARVIQKKARTKLASNQEKRQGAARMLRATLVIQSIVRAQKTRRYVEGLRLERARFTLFNRSVIKAQGVFRMGLALRVVRRKRAAHRSVCASKIQQTIKVFAARRQLVKLRQEAEPFEFVFLCNRDKHTSKSNPWSWQLVMHPIDQHGRVRPLPCQPIDLFTKTGASEWKGQAAVKIQAAMRGKLAKISVAKQRVLWDMLRDDVLNGACRLYETRRKAAVRIQSLARGRQLRKQGILAARYQKWEEKVIPKLIIAQSYMSRFAAQKWLTQFATEGKKDQYAVVIQAHWRGWLARHQVELIREEMLWPVKGWFDYQGMGRDSVRVSVQFFPNPRFSESKHFGEYGTMEDMNRSIQSMATEVTKTKEVACSQDANFPEEEQKVERAEEGQKTAQRAKSRQAAEMGTQEQANTAEEESRKNAEEDANMANTQAQEATQAAGLKEETSRQEAAQAATSKQDETQRAEDEARERREEEDAKWHSQEKEKADRRTAAEPAEIAKQQAAEKQEKKAASLKREQAAWAAEASGSPMGGSQPSQTGGSPIAGSASESASRWEESQASPQGSQSQKAHHAHHYTPPNVPPPIKARKHYAGTLKNNVFVRSNAASLNDLSQWEQEDILADIADERKRKVEELQRRQRKHAAKRRKEQQRESKNLGHNSSGNFSDEERQQKVQDLKMWLKKREETEGNNYEIHQNARIADERRTILAQHMAKIQLPQRVLHRHVHHHVHQQDGTESGRLNDQQLPGLRPSASAGQLNSAAATGAMPWRPMVHSASSGQAPGMTQTMPGGFYPTT